MYCTPTFYLILIAHSHDDFLLRSSWSSYIDVVAALEKDSLLKHVLF